MKTLMIALIGVLVAAPAAVPQAELPKPIGMGDMHRFLFFAVFEGLWEDGANVALIKQVRLNPWDLFIGKCPICNAVGQGFDVYSAAPRPLGEHVEGKGTGLPIEIASDLRSFQRDSRLRGLDHLVDRYVKRRFERIRMTDGERRPPGLRRAEA